MAYPVQGAALLQVPSMKVLFVKRTVDRQDFELLLGARERGVDIRVMTVPNSPWRARLEEAGIFVATPVYRSKFNLRAILFIRRYVKAHGITVLHAGEGKSLSNAIWATYGLPVRIIGYRGTLAQIRKTDLGYWMGVLNPRVSRIICVNRSIYEYMQNFYPREHLLLNYKGYESDWGDEASSAPLPIPEVPDDAFVIMYIAKTQGREHKGLNILVQAMHQMPDPRVHLVHIGAHDPSSATLAKSGPAAARIHLLGERKEGVRYLHRADIYVLPSVRDGLPRSVKEAMAQAKPVIVTNIPGPSELIVDGESGVLIPPGSPAAIVDAVMGLIDDPARRSRLGEAARKRLKESFSAEVFVEKAVALYREVEQERVAMAGPTER
jgi:L-malate glycosyltransferase